MNLFDAREYFQGEVVVVEGAFVVLSGRFGNRVSWTSLIVCLSGRDGTLGAWSVPAPHNLKYYTVCAVIRLYGYCPIPNSFCGNCELDVPGTVTSDWCAEVV